MKGAGKLAMFLHKRGVISVLRKRGERGSVTIMHEKRQGDLAMLCMRRSGGTINIKQKSGKGGLSLLYMYMKGSSGGGL